MMEKHQVFVFGHYAGVVFGTGIDETGDDGRLLARFDFDQCFGTVLNRYCAEAVIDHPLSPLWYRSAKERLKLSGITGRKTAKNH